MPSATEICTECHDTGRVGVSYPTDYGTGSEWDWVACPNGCPPTPHTVSSQLHDDVLHKLAVAKSENARMRGLLARWRHGLVPVGDYELRRETDELLNREVG